MDVATCCKYHFNPRLSVQSTGAGVVMDSYPYNSTVITIYTCHIITISVLILVTCFRSRVFGHVLCVTCNFRSHDE